MTSEWPLRNFVAEWTTTSAPRVSGRTRCGVAKVLSTTNRPAALQPGDRRGGDVGRRVAEAAVPVLVQTAGLDVGVGLVVEVVGDGVVDRRDDWSCARREGPRLRRAVHRLPTSSWRAPSSA